MMMQKPMLAVVSGDVANSEMKTIFDKTEIGFCYEQATDDFDGLKDYILSVYNGNIYSPNIEEVEKYNYENISKRILDLLN
jgi:hypothetical protein